MINGDPSKHSMHTQNNQMNPFPHFFFLFMNHLWWKVIKHPFLSFLEVIYFFVTTVISILGEKLIYALYSFNSNNFFKRSLKMDDTIKNIFKMGHITFYPKVLISCVLDDIVSRVIFFDVLILGWLHNLNKEKKSFIYYQINKVYEKNIKIIHQGTFCVACVTLLANLLQ